MLDFLCRKQILCGFNIQSCCAQQSWLVILLTSVRLQGGEAGTETENIPQGQAPECKCWAKQDRAARKSHCRNESQQQSGCSRSRRCFLPLTCPHLPGLPWAQGGQSREAQTCPWVLQGTNGVLCLSGLVQLGDETRAGCLQGNKWLPAAL